MSVGECAKGSTARVLPAAIAAALLLAGCDRAAEPVPAAMPSGRTASPPAPAPTPDLASCPKAEPIEERIRTAPIALPAVLERLGASSMDHFAFTTLTGDTVCVDTTWLETIDDATLSDDGRFAAFSWVGYEAFGHVIVDRSGAGQVVDTGNPPQASPSGRRLAAVDLGEAGFGSLNAFGVWEIRRSGLAQLAAVSEGFITGDWRIDSWRGDSCVQLSVVPLDRQPDDYRDIEKAPRDSWFAAEANAWKPVEGTCPAR